MALMPSTSMMLDFVPEGGPGTIGSMSCSRLRTFAIETWRRFDFDNFQAFIDRRNSSARKLIMYLKQELTIPPRGGLKWPELQTYPLLRWAPQYYHRPASKELIASTVFRLHQREASFLAPLSISLARPSSGTARLAVRSISLPGTALP